MASPVKARLPFVWGEGVRSLRKIRGLNQTQLAEQVGTTQTKVSDIELDRGYVPDALRVRIAQVLGVDPYELFTYRDENGDVA